MTGKTAQRSSGMTVRGYQLRYRAVGNRQPSETLRWATGQPEELQGDSSAGQQRFVFHNQLGLRPGWWMERDPKRLDPTIRSTRPLRTAFCACRLRTWPPFKNEGLIH